LHRSINSCIRASFSKFPDDPDSRVPAMLFYRSLSFVLNPSATVKELTPRMQVFGSKKQVTSSHPATDSPLGFVSLRVIRLFCERIKNRLLLIRTTAGVVACSHKAGLGGLQSDQIWTLVEMLMEYLARLSFNPVQETDRA
jgi:hypothetical protein